MQNGLVDPTDDNVISKLVEKLDNWFGKTEMDELAEGWKNFKSLEREKDESIDKYILRYETSESDLKCSDVDIPQKILAIQLLDTLNVDENQRRNILTAVNVDDPTNIYENMKRSVRLLKGSLVENNDNKSKEEDAFIGES